jgi:CDP-glycerol glycerophosphotransferase (TagB/SpsB family)
MGGFVYNYEENAPGLKAKTQGELLKAITSSLLDRDLFIKQRKLVKTRFHTHQDENSSNRIIKSIFQ